MNYTLNQLQVFLKVAQTQSVTKAAEQLHLSQPAVSIQLRNFQEQFDMPLTEVVGRKIYITDFGKEIAAAAEAILEQVEAINQKVLAYKGQMVGKLKISVVSTGKYVMPFFLSDFVKMHPGIELMMDVTNKMKVIESLQGNEVDFSLVSIVPQNLQVNTLDLLENHLYLVGNKEAKVADFSIGLLEKVPLIFREKGSGTRQSMEHFLEHTDARINKKLELTSNEAVKQAVLAGLGYSIMPLIGIKKEVREGSIQIVPFEGLPIKTVWQLIWLKGKKLSPVALAFLHYIQAEKNNIINNHFLF